MTLASYACRETRSHGLAVSCARLRPSLHELSFSHAKTTALQSSLFRMRIDTLAHTGLYGVSAGVSAYVSSGSAEMCRFGPG